MIELRIIGEEGQEFVVTDADSLDRRDGYAMQIQIFGVDGEVIALAFLPEEIERLIEAFEFHRSNAPMAFHVLNGRTYYH